MDNIEKWVYCIALIVAIVTSVGLYAFSSQLRTEERADCSYFENYSLSHIPARCLEYYGINK